jgi:LDH2 family malate/lactate/ureidoglycolate dehydrogenase
MAHLYFDTEVLRKFCTDAFCNFGFSPEDSAVITANLLMADIYGIESHGVQRLQRYHKSIQNGKILLDVKPEIVFETPLSAVVDGHNGMGQVSGHYSMQIAIEKAKKSGMAIVSTRNSNHYGIAGYYAKMACDEGLIGLSFTNSEAIMVPTFGRQAMLGSNPIAISMPAEPYPFFFDASTTVVTRGKVEMYNKAEKPLPEGWTVNKDGIPTTDALEILTNINQRAGGGILPLGGSEEKTGSHKGYGYGMLCEIFCSILSQGKTSNNTRINGLCHGFIAIDPAMFGDPKAIEDHLSTFLQELRDSPKAAGHDRIFTHGEKAAMAIERSKKQGVPVDEKTVIEMKDMADYLKMDFESYFGKLDIDFNSGYKASF